jgi:hypothetical protein
LGEESLQMLSAVGYQQSQDLEWVGGMAWVKPIYSRTRVDQAGFEYVDREVSPEEREIALAVINNWRTSHHFPLNDSGELETTGERA